jgi:hypothetical protein
MMPLKKPQFHWIFNDHPIHRHEFLEDRYFFQTFSHDSNEPLKCFFRKNEEGLQRQQLL